MMIKRVFYTAGGSASGGGGFRGRWDPDVAYRAGDVVTHGGAVFGASAATTGVDPVGQLDVFDAAPSDLAVSDAGDYELVAYFEVTEPVRVTDLCFYKSSLQTAVPHLLSLWDRDVSTTTPLATASAGQESAGYVGVVSAPLVADLVPGRRYAVSVKTGTGGDSGYTRSTGAVLPVITGVVTVTAVGFSSVVGSIATVTTGTTNFFVWPRVETVASGWDLLARREPVVAGVARTVSRTPLPDFLAARPNDGSGFWADASNTGHTADPDYAGSVADFTTGMTATGWVPVQVADGSVISGKRFLGKAGIGYAGVGDDLVFEGCLFEATMPNDGLVQIYSPTSVTFVNCTFKPAANATPPGNNGTVTSSPTSPGTGYDDSWQYIARMVAGQTTFERCNIWGGAGVQATGGVDAAHRSVFRRCYIHDCADTDDSGAPVGQEYHHDGLGPDSEGGGHDTLIDGCTIGSIGSTNGIALQGASNYTRVEVRDCYLGGFGYTVSLGVTEPWAGTHIRVLRNVFTAELPVVFGPLYGNLWVPGNGNLWRGNRYQVRSGDAATAWDTGDHGSYWWPTDNLGHPVDYAN